jgi:hypothetical protein
VGQSADHSTEADHEGHGEHESAELPEPPQLPSPEPVVPADRVTEKSASVPLAIRASAVLDTGRRRIAYRQRPDGAFELVTLTVGPRAVGTDDQGQSAVYFTVLDGLHEGDTVVVRAGFLLDSQRQIEGMPSLFFPQGAAPSAGHDGHGGQEDTTPGQNHRGTTDMDKMRSELQKFSPEDRASAERQHVCPVTGKMLGTMGPPQKVDIRGRAVWICCPACKDEFVKNADSYLAKLATP